MPGSVCWASQKVALFLGVTKRSAKSRLRDAQDTTWVAFRPIAKWIAAVLTPSGPFFRYSESGRWGRHAAAARTLNSQRQLASPLRRLALQSRMRHGRLQCEQDRQRKCVKKLRLNMSPSPAMDLNRNPYISSGTIATPVGAQSWPSQKSAF